jgi:hypothetical protein
MMNNSHLIHQQSILHREELIRQADAFRLRQIGRTDQPPRWRGVRNRLGGWLIAAGEQLRVPVSDTERNHYATTTNRIAV